MIKPQSISRNLLTALLLVPPGAVTQAGADQEPLEVRPERGPVVKNKGHSGDGALNGSSNCTGPLTRRSEMAT